MFSKNEFGMRIRSARKKAGLTQGELGQRIKLSVAGVSRYERGEIEVNIEMASKFAHALNVSPLYLIGMDDDPSSGISNLMPLPETERLPILGTIACGEPILAIENIEDYADVPTFVHADFVLRCKGDSMIGARIKDGDLVYIRQQPDVENGEIAAVLIGSEATLKRVYKKPGYIALQPENPAYEPMFITPQDEPVRILGRAVGFTSKI